MTYTIVPDALREREPPSKKPLSEISKTLLAGRTVFEVEKKNFGSLYTLAKNHGMKCTVKRTTINGKTGSLIWFEDTLPKKGT